jgi:hypothetical protein
LRFNALILTESFLYPHGLDLVTPASSGVNSISDSQAGPSDSIARFAGAAIPAEPTATTQTT